jgi:ribonuclease P protein component
VAEEAEGEAHVSAEQPETSEAARLPVPDVHPGRPGDPPNPAPEGPRAPLGLIGRVGDRATFDALRRDGRRARRGPMTVVYLPGGNDVRVAYAIGRKVGPAVVRNRVRRRLREAVRELDRTTAGGLECGAYLVTVRPESAGCTYSELRDDLERACAALRDEAGR